MEPGFAIGDTELSATQAPPFELSCIGKRGISPIEQREGLPRTRHRHVVEPALLLEEAASLFRGVVGAPSFPSTGEHDDMGEPQPLGRVHGAGQHPVSDDV